MKYQAQNGKIVAVKELLHKEEAENRLNFMKSRKAKVDKPERQAQIQARIDALQTVVDSIADSPANITPSSIQGKLPAQKPELLPVNDTFTKEDSDVRIQKAFTKEEAQEILHRMLARYDRLDAGTQKNLLAKRIKNLDEEIDKLP
jgi:hypothetical protein